jgi:hypothetical protein
MAKFLLKCFLFSIPIVGVFAFPFAVFLLSGEFLSVASVINRQAASPSEILYYSGFSSASGKSYKTVGTEKYDPEIVVVGRSRTLTFRSIFFKDPAKFYNAGAPQHRASELSDYVNGLKPGNHLKVIMLDLSGLLEEDKVPPEVRRESTYSLINLFLTSGWRDVYSLYFDHKFSFGQVLEERKNHPAIGLYALITHSGYRPDGSMSRGDAAEMLALRNRAPALVEQEVAKINSEKSVFGYDTLVSDQNLAALKSFLALCKEKNIYVVGYLSPYAFEIYQKIESMEGPDGDRLRSVPPVISSIFAQHGFTFFDVRDIRLIGSSDDELYDAGHTTEKSTLKLLRYLAPREPHLASYLDTDSLNRQISSLPF